MFLSKMLIHSCRIEHYTVKENTFVVIICRILEILKSHVNDCFKINDKQMIKTEKVKYVRFKN